MNDSVKFSLNSSAEQRCVYVDQGNCYKTWEHLLRDVHEYLAFKPHEWVFIIIFAVIFLIGSVGNFLVCYVVLRNKKMRIVTNVFIFNLSLSDLLVIIFCLPSTVVEDVMETWFFGITMCKLLKYLQRVSVYVSVITLTTISIDRCRAIASPFRARLGVRSAILVIFLIWILAMSAASPDLIFYRTVPTFRPENITVLMTICGIEAEAYEGQHLPLFWAPFLGFFVLPLLVMSIAYSLTAKRLWHRDASLQNGQGIRSDSQLTSRRNTAKMLIVVVVFFFVCYLPVHVYEILKYFNLLQLANVDPHVALSLLTSTHLLVYINSSLNPVIYTFMSGTFRHEFKNVFRACCCLRNKHPSRSCERLGSTTRETITVTGFTGNGVRKDASQSYSMIVMDDM